MKKAHLDLYQSGLKLLIISLVKTLVWHPVDYHSSTCHFF
jgi:hypothetical protein